MSSFCDVVVVCGDRTGSSPVLMLQLGCLHYLRYDFSCYLWLYDAQSHFLAVRCPGAYFLKAVPVDLMGIFVPCTGCQGKNSEAGMGCGKLTPMRLWRVAPVTLRLFDVYLWLMVVASFFHSEARYYPVQFVSHCVFALLFARYDAGFWLLRVYRAVCHSAHSPRYVSTHLVHDTKLHTTIHRIPSGAELGQPCKYRAPLYSSRVAVPSPAPPSACQSVLRGHRDSREHTAGEQIIEEHNIFLKDIDTFCDYPWSHPRC
ncbi:hypothetical protein OE88DRAFT_391184 [Heliocybe sulcata]|uniref:Uncharacterized protein n=1 Tax=Heliocybe sulcata TaxID=5364 RepID=A0A5C3MY46_9AGAM|nr:hypothetical protein OE88DRAFT_391184 [Heliocybe sulcata]